MSIDAPFAVEATCIVANTKSDMMADRHSPKPTFACLFLSLISGVCRIGDCGHHLHCRSFSVSAALEGKIHTILGSDLKRAYFKDGLTMHRCGKSGLILLCDHLHVRAQRQR